MLGKSFPKIPLHGQTDRGQANIKRVVKNSCKITNNFNRWIQISPLWHTISFQNFPLLSCILNFHVSDYNCWSKIFKSSLLKSFDYDTKSNNPIYLNEYFPKIISNKSCNTIQTNPTSALFGKVSIKFNVL